MTRLLDMWKKSEVLPPQAAVSDAFMQINEQFKSFLMNCSWFIYFIAGLLIMGCICYYIYDCKRRLDLRRRRQELQRANESRVAQRRRPGAAYRDHEIFRNVMQTVRQYIEPRIKTKNEKYKPYVVKRTRSGRIYGHYDDRESEHN